MQSSVLPVLVPVAKLWDAILLSCEARAKRDSEESCSSHVLRHKYRYLSDDEYVTVSSPQEMGLHTAFCVSGSCSKAKIKAIALDTSPPNRHLQPLFRADGHTMREYVAITLFKASGEQWRPRLLSNQKWVSK